MTGDRGLLLGRIGRHVVRAPDHDHVLCTAPTKSGKTTCFVNPNLLSLGAASAVVNDPDGESYWVTRRARASEGAVYLWAPFAERSHSYNPLDFIRAGTSFEVDDVQVLADLLMEPERGSDPYWDREAKALLVAVLIYVVRHRPVLLRTMAEVHHLLNLGEAAFKRLMEGMIFSGHSVCRKVANALASYSDGQRGGILGSLRAHISIWHSENLQGVTGWSDFRFADLRKQTATVYVVVPPEHAASFRPALRLIHGLALADCRRGATTHRRRVVFLLDEFANLGRLEPVVKAIAIARKAGIQLCLFIQNTAQVASLYGEDWKTLAANCRTRVAFGINDYDDAKRLSDNLGVRTVRTRSHGSNAGLADVVPDRLNRNEGEASRPLMTPDELMAMDARHAIILQQGVRPILADKLHYQDPMFAGLWDNWTGSPASLIASLTDGDGSRPLALPAPGPARAPALSRVVVSPVCRPGDRSAG